jgi:hypothetical protein
MKEWITSSRTPLLGLSRILSDAKYSPASFWISGDMEKMDTGSRVRGAAAVAGAGSVEAAGRPPPEVALNSCKKLHR